MGLSYSTETLEDVSGDIYKIMSYNVEWGFLNVPKDIHSDSCGHLIPGTKLSSEKHLTLIAKNIGLISPDICFLQEMGSQNAVDFLTEKINILFGVSYKSYYSNKNEKGYQGVGLLIRDSIDENCKVENIPNFKLNRALGVTLNTGKKEYKLIGVHLKSLYDGRYIKDVTEQESEIQAVLDWVNNNPDTIICGDFNNIPNSSPITKMLKADYKNALDTDKFLLNIVGNKSTEFHGKNGKETGSVIDYMFITNTINLVSSHIVNYTREAKVPKKGLRGETSDHLPIVGIFRL